MIGFGLFILVVVLGGMALGIGALVLAVVFWKKRGARYIFLALFLLGFYPLYRLVTYDPNHTDRAKAWHGIYDVRCSPNGFLILRPDQTFELSSSSPLRSRVGHWEYVITEDGDWLDLYFKEGGIVQLTGDPENARAEYMIGTGTSCTFARRNSR